MVGNTVYLIVPKDCYGDQDIVSLFSTLSAAIEFYNYCSQSNIKVCAPREYVVPDLNGREDLWVGFFNCEVGYDCPWCGRQPSVAITKTALYQASNLYEELYPCDDGGCYDCIEVEEIRIDEKVGI